MMLEKLQKIEERLREVERQLADPAVYTDQQKLARLMREQKELAPVVSVYHALLRAQQAQEEAEQMLSAGGAAQRPRRAGAPVRGAEAAASAARPQRREKRHFGGARRDRR